MSERPFVIVEPGETETVFGPIYTAHIPGVCPLCETHFTIGTTPVQQTSWRRTVHPSCLAQPTIRKTTV